MEEARGIRMSGKRKVPTRMEKQNCVAKIVHDEGAQTGPDDIRYDVINMSIIIIKLERLYLLVFQRFYRRKTWF